jgi:hypothetical protein
MTMPKKKCVLIPMTREQLEEAVSMAFKHGATDPEAFYIERVREAFSEAFYIERVRRGFRSAKLSRQRLLNARMPGGVVKERRGKDYELS